MPQGVVTCRQCGRALRGGLRFCPYDNSRLPLPDGPLPPPGPDVARTLPLPEVDPMAQTAPASAPITGQKLGDFVVGGVLGSGGMGEVYEGEQPLIGKKVAIKVLKASIAGDQVNVARLLAEARAVNAIRHRGIVDIFNFGTLPDGRPYLVMEYLEGEPLDQLLSKRVALSALETAELLEEVCSALAAAHARGIVHRDLKPGNVFVVTDRATRARYAKLLDFGLAKGQPTLDGQKPATREGFVVGTPDYIAPEQARGIGVSPRSDLYSLGVMAFELLTGRLPFLAASAIETMSMHVHQPPPRLSSLANDVPPALERLVARLLAKAPGDRPGSADEVRRTLAQLARKLRDGATTLSPEASASDARTLPFEPVGAPPPATPTRTAPVPAPETRTQERHASVWRANALALVLAGLAAAIAIGAALAVRAQRQERLAARAATAAPGPGAAAPAAPLPGASQDAPAAPLPGASQGDEPAAPSEPALQPLPDDLPEPAAKRKPSAQPGPARPRLESERARLKQALEHAYPRALEKHGRPPALVESAAELRRKLDSARTLSELGALEPGVKEFETLSR